MGSKAELGVNLNGEKEQQEEMVNAGTPRRDTATTLGRRLRANSVGTKGTEGYQVMPRDLMQGKEKRKNSSPADGESGRAKRYSTGGGEESSDEGENLDSTVVEVEDDKVEEEAWKRSLDQSTDASGIVEVKTLLKQVMMDYRNKTKELEREKLSVGKSERGGLKEEFEGLKRHFDESNEKWRKDINRELGKMNAEIQAVRREVEEWNEKGGGGQAAVNEDLRKEIEELK